MAKYDIYEIDSGGILLLEIQSDMLRDLKTTVVVPLLPVTRSQMVRLTPIFKIGNAEYMMDSPQISSIMRRDLGKLIGHLHPRWETDVTAALDLLLTGS